MTDQNNSENWEKNEQTSIQVPNIKPKSNFTKNLEKSTKSKKINVFELLEEYDEKDINELDRYVKFTEDDEDIKMNITDFITDSLNDEKLYEVLKELWNGLPSNNKQIYHVKLLLTDRDDIAKKLNLPVEEFEYLYLKYKILKCFYGKDFQRNLFIDENVSFEYIFQKNNYLIDMFVNLILYWDIDIFAELNKQFNNLNNKLFNEKTSNILASSKQYSQKDNIKLSIFLKMVACVILYYCKKTKKNKSNNGYKSIDEIKNNIEKNIVDNDEKRIALSYLSYLNSIFQKKQLMTNAQYFKLFGRIRRTKSSFSQSIYNNREERNERQREKEKRNEERMNQASRYEEQFERKAPKIKMGAVKPTGVNTGKLKSHSETESENKKKGKQKATEEDKARLIKNTFEKMVDINLSNKIEESGDYRLGCNIKSFDTLKQIYVKHIKIFDQLISILISLKSRINIDNKKQKDNCYIHDTLKTLKRLLDNISTIFKKSTIESLFEKILKNIEKYIEIYKELCSIENKKPNQINNSKVNEYLGILGIDITEFSPLDQSAKIEKIKESYRELAREKHPNKHPNEANKYTKEFQKLGEAYENLLKIYSGNVSSNTNVKLNIGSNTSKKSNALVLSTKLSNTTNLLDIIIENLNSSLMDQLQFQHNLKKYLTETLTNLKSCYSLFTPFNTLFNDKFNQKKNSNDKFILLLDNDIVKRFFSNLTDKIDRKDIDKYEQLCNNIQSYIRYINYGVEFINSNKINNKETFKKLVYYNFFHNLNNVIQIILKSLTQENPQYQILKFVQSALGTISSIMKKGNKDLYEFKTEKNYSETEKFAPNTRNVRKVGKENVKDFKKEIKDEISELIKNNNNSNISSLLHKLNGKYEIEPVKKINKGFLDKLKSTFGFTKNINSNGFEEIIKKLRDKVSDKYSLLEFLYIYVISFSQQERFKIFENIKQQKEQIKESNVQVEEVLSNIEKEKKKRSETNAIIASLKEFEKGLLGTKATNEQKLLAYEIKAKELLKKNKSANKLALVLSEITNSSPLAKKYMNKQRLLLEQGPSVSKTSNIKKNRIIASKPVSTNSDRTTGNNSTFNKKSGEMKTEVLKLVLKSIDQKNKLKMIKKIDPIITQIANNKSLNIKSLNEYKEEVQKRLNKK